MRLDGKITHGMVMDVESVGADNISFVFGPVGAYIDSSLYYTKEEIDAMLANVGVQSDWNVTDTSSKAYIKHKPTIPTSPVQSDWNESDSTSLAYIKNKPGATSQVQSDWAQSDSSAVDYIKNKPTIPAAQVQSNWNESDTSSKAYIQNKPTIPTKTSDLTNDSCPIIEDTRSSNAVNITGNAPFSTLVDKQKVIIHLAYATSNYTTLQLTLNDGVTTTAAIPIYARTDATWVGQIKDGHFRGETYMELIYNSSQNRWYCLNLDRDTTNWAMSQSEINNASNTSTRAVPNAKLIHDNAYIVETTYSSGSLKANKMYDFGTVSTALTIPSLDATNDLVSNALNFYALRFIAGADNISITFPTGVIVDDEPTINTGDYVEIMINLYVENNINHFYASIKVWQAQ